ncbi:MAG: hypothetical protein H8E37_13810, partial [Planctomycetes bacterium]|nr:hypothetical protein [Planctomycetota bacterium]
MAGHEGGCGSVLATTMHNPGPDREDGTADDVVAPLNRQPVSTAIDMRPGSGWGDSGDRAQRFRSAHTRGA